MNNFARNVWLGFWSAAAFFFRCMAEGFRIISDMCAAISGKDATDE